MGKLIKTGTLTALLVTAAVGNSYAATQGTLGATSTGTASLSITKSVQAQISDIQDMTLSNWSIGGGAVSLSSNICVYSSTGNYKVTATGSGSSNAFTVASGANTIPYTVTWDFGGVGSLGTGSTASLTSGTQSAGYTTASTTSALCNGGGASNDTARVTVGITSANMTSAPSSSTPYTGTLTMMVTPY